MLRGETQLIVLVEVESNPAQLGPHVDVHLSRVLEKCGFVRVGSQKNDVEELLFELRDSP